LTDEDAHRRFSRFDFHVPVLVRNPRNRSRLFGRMEQLGRGGCSVKAPGPVSPAAPLEVEISLGGGAVRATARVVYQRSSADGDWELGLEFLDVHPADRPLLDLALREARGDLEN
jgi:hypothetical protein